MLIGRERTEIFMGETNLRGNIKGRKRAFDALNATRLATLHLSVESA